MSMFFYNIVDITKIEMLHNFAKKCHYVKIFDMIMSKLARLCESNSVLGIIKKAKKLRDDLKNGTNIA